MKRRIALASVMSLLALIGIVGLSPRASAADWGGSGASVSQCSYGAKVYTVGAPVRLKYASGVDAGYVEVRWSDWCPRSNWARLTSNVTAGHLAISIRENSRPSNQAGADDYNTSQNLDSGDPVGQRDQLGLRLRRHLQLPRARVRSRVPLIRSVTGPVRSERVPAPAELSTRTIGLAGTIQGL